MIDDQDAVVRTLQPLSARQRAAVVLIDLLGYPRRRRAGCWASARSTVRTYAGRAHRDLKARMDGSDE